MKDNYRFFTIWSLLISFSIFVWSIFMNIPIWLFLFAACLLSVTSVIGTFFLTVPSVPITTEKYDVTHKDIILLDSLIHLGPLVVFLLLFNFLKRRTFGNKDLRKTSFLAVFIALCYLGHIKFSQIYNSYDYFCLITLGVCVFLSSYQIYTNIG